MGDFTGRTRRGGRERATHLVPEGTNQVAVGDVEGWMEKPFDSLRLLRVYASLREGEILQEGR